MSKHEYKSSLIEDDMGFFDTANGSHFTRLEEISIELGLIGEVFTDNGFPSIGPSKNRMERAARQQEVLAIFQKDDRLIRKIEEGLDELIKNRIKLGRGLIPEGQALETLGNQFDTYNPTSPRLKAMRDFFIDIRQDPSFQDLRAYEKAIGQFRLEYDERKSKIGLVLEERNGIRTDFSLSSKGEIEILREKLKSQVSAIELLVHGARTKNNHPKSFQRNLHHLKQGLDELDSYFSFGGRIDGVFPDEQAQNWFNDLYIPLIQSIHSELERAKQRLNFSFNLKDMHDELNMYNTMVKLARLIKEKGYPICEKATFLPETERRIEYKESYSIPEILMRVYRRAQKRLGRRMEGEIPEGKIVPNDITLDHNYPIYVFEGPNNAGKTTLLRQVLSNELVLGWGGLLPAAEVTTSSPDNIFLCLVNKDDPESGFGAWKTQTTLLAQMADSCCFANSKESVRRDYQLGGLPLLTSRSLIVLNEYGNATDRQERQRCLEEELLPLLRQRGAVCLISTHCHDLIDTLMEKYPSFVKQFGSRIEQTAKGIVYTYKMIEGLRVGSYGDAVTHASGFTAERISKGTEKLREIMPELVPKQ